LEFTATPLTSPRYKSAGNFKKPGTESYGMLGATTLGRAEASLAGTCAICADAAAKGVQSGHPTA
jgi:hypothetical protein